MAEIRPFGEDAILIDYSSSDTPLSAVLRAHAAAAAIDGVRDRIPAAQTLLLRFDGPAKSYLKAVEEGLRNRHSGSSSVGTRQEVHIPVHYDGADLQPLAEELQMSAEALVRWHTAQPWMAAFGGFAPGFFYLVRPQVGGQGSQKQGEEVLDIPRLATPRTKVPKGSVGLAGAFAGVYPIESPGGWRLLGHTEVEMWDATKENPALLAPGVRVYFTPVKGGN